MKINMKKVISVFLAFVTVFSLVLPAFAAREKCDCGTTPVIHVHGFAGEDLFLDPGSDDPESVFPPSAGSIVKAVPSVFGVLGALVTGNNRWFGKAFSKTLNALMGKMACDKNGDPLYNVGIAPEPTQPDTHKTGNYSFTGSYLKPDGVGQFTFFYDWRLDPVAAAEKLHAFGEEIKVLTGHDKISIVCHSEGNVVGSSYIALYGGSDIDKMVFLSPAFKGLSLIGSAFTKDISVVGKSDELVEYLDGFIGGSDAGRILVPLLRFLDKTGLLPLLINRLGKALEASFDYIYDASLRDVFGTLPGIWSFCPDEYYAAAKQTMFGGKEEEYAGLIKKLDNYHYNVQNKLEENLAAAIEEGASIIICAGYGISTIPVTGEPEYQADMLIDTGYMSIGASCPEYGKTFGDGYTQANTSCGHSHLSPDLTVDASTCAFPEYTWFFRGQSHNEFTAAYNSFLTWALLYDGQPTVSSDPAYPQFMENSGGKLVPAR